MRHKRVGRKLGVTTKHRRSMFRNMVTDLFRHERIKTTDTRAKELRRVAEKYITIAKKGTLQARRMAATFVRDKDVLKKLFDELASRFKERPGGYTRIVKLGVRAGDNAPISLIELIAEEYKPKKKRPRRAKKNKEDSVASEPTAKSTKKESAEELGLSELEEKTDETQAKTENAEEVKRQTKEEQSEVEAKSKDDDKVEEAKEVVEPSAEDPTPEEDTGQAEAKTEPEPQAETQSKADESEDEPESEQQADSEESSKEPEDKSESDDTPKEVTQDKEEKTEEEFSDKKE